MPAAAKDAVRDLLDKLPDDASLEDIRYHIYVQQRVDEGLEDIAEGRTLSHEEVEHQMAKWLKESPPRLTRKPGALQALLDERATDR